jgi:hypothetical protein
MTHSRQLTLAIALGAVALFTVLMAPLGAQDIVVNPGTIQGTVQVAGEILTSGNVSTSGTSAGLSLSGGDSGTYTLTVNLGESGSATYSVSAYAYTNGNRSRVHFPSQSVSVTEGSPGQADFRLDDPGFVEGTVTVVGGGTLSSAFLNFYRSSASGYTQSYAWTYSWSGGAYRVPVAPNDSISVTGYAYVNGIYVALPSRTIDVGPGEIVANDYVAGTPPPPVSNAIRGTISMPGPVTPIRYYVAASNRSTSLYPPFGDGSYELTQLPDGTVGMYAYTYFADGGGFYHPNASFSPSRTVSLSGSDATVDITTPQAFVEGTFGLTGAAQDYGLQYAQLYVYGQYPTASHGGQGWGYVSNGAYRLILGPGDWDLRNVYLRLYTQGQLDEYFYFNDYRGDWFTLAEGETAFRDLELATGSVTVSMSVANGSLLSYPRLYGNCYHYAENGALQWYYSFNSYANHLVNVANPSVTLVGPAGRCTITAQAQIGSSWLTLGSIVRDVVPGVDQVVDAGGPTLTVTFPEPDYITGGATLVVQGMVTDDTSVDGVTVAGLPASLVSTGNPDDPAESSFEASVALEHGPNEIVTVATDSAGKTATDRRTVYRDEGPPTASWTPADGFVTPEASVPVEGWADDDAGVDAVTVDGGVVSLASAGDPSHPNRVTFSVTVGSLLEGDNFVEVVVTDVSGRSTAQTHRIERRLNTPPSLSLPSGLTAEATGRDGAVVTWDATAADAEEGALTPSCSPASGVTFALGATTVHCSVTDSGGLSDSGSFTVTVRDTTPPSLSCPAFEPAVGCMVAAPDLAALMGVSDLVTPSASLTFQQSPEAGAELDLGGHSLTITVTDQAGNSASCSSTFQVVNGEPSISLVGEPWAVGEGGELTLEAVGSDPEEGPVTYSWDVSGSGFVAGASTATFSAAGADGPDTVTVRAMVLDECGLYSQASGVVTIENLPPEVASLVAPEQPVRLGDAIEASVSFVDAGTPDTHTAAWEWGDGTAPEAGAATQWAGSGSSTATHTYAAPGVYTVTVTVADDDGGSGTAGFQYVVVYDPEGGFVTGGGWIESPEGAYPSEPTLTGKASFGFVSKYKKGASVPTGQTQFQFHAAGMDFHSTAYGWLVIAGARAQYKGTGAIDGEGDYGFLLTAVDGQVAGGGGVDRFRIKIWDRADGDAVVYDSQAGAGDDVEVTSALGGGSIVIHDGKAGQ